MVNNELVQEKRKIFVVQVVA